MQDFLQGVPVSHSEKLHAVVKTKLLWFNAVQCKQSQLIIDSSRIHPTRTPYLYKTEHEWPTTMNPNGFSLQNHYMYVNKALLDSPSVMFIMSWAPCHLCIKSLQISLNDVFLECPGLVLTTEFFSMNITSHIKFTLTDLLGEQSASHHPIVSTWRQKQLNYLLVFQGAYIKYSRASKLNLETNSNHKSFLLWVDIFNHKTFTVI